MRGTTVAGATRVAAACFVAGTAACSGGSASTEPSERPREIAINATATEEPRGATGEPTPTPTPTPAEQPRVVITPVGEFAGVVVDAEVAVTPAETQRGLMFRRSLGANAGMLFLFDHEHQLTFWMHNTYIPLDMIFIRSDMTVLGVVENATPRTDDPREVPGDSQYVLEVNAGFAREHHIGPGARVTFEHVRPAPTPAD